MATGRGVAGYAGARLRAAALRAQRARGVRRADRDHRRAHAKGASRSNAERRCMTLARLTPADLPIETRALAQALLGRVLVRRDDDGITAGRIVETEAYLPRRSGMPRIPRQERPQRNALRSAAPRVRLSDLRHVILLQSLERARRSKAPASWFARSSRSRVWRSCGAPRDLDRARPLPRSGPALPSARHRSFIRWNRFVRTIAPLAGRRPARSRRACARSPRIGITQAANRRLRFYAAGNPYVSGPARLSPA